MTRTFPFPRLRMTRTIRPVPGMSTNLERVSEDEPENERAAALAELRGWDRERAKAWERDTELLLRERELNRRRGSGRVELPTHLTVSSLVTLASDPKALARQIRRPVPKKPTPLARRGTSFHRWLESRWGQQRLMDEFELPGASDDFEETDAQLDELRGPVRGE